MKQKLNKLASFLKDFLSNYENLKLLALIIICLSLFKMAFFGIKINGDVSIDGSIGTSTNVEGKVEVYSY